MPPVDPTDATSNLGSGGEAYLPPSSVGGLSRSTAKSSRREASEAASACEQTQGTGPPSATESSDQPRGGPPRGDARYLPGDELGRGGWGRVERARDKQLDRDVAVKRINRELAGASTIADRFFHEARVTGRLQHPGIVPVHELGVGEDGAPFYVMKLLDGVTFKETIRSVHEDASQLADGFSIDLLTRFLDVCNAVAYSHQQGILHRDLKPSNIMVGEFGETIVVDWGLAKQIEIPREASHSDGDLDATVGSKFYTPTPLSSSSKAPRTGSGSGAVLGTPAYMSPEQSEGESNSLTPATDIYALGVILYEVLTGENPFRSKDIETTLSRVRAGQYKPPRAVNGRVPRALAAICTTAMSRRAEDRYERAEQIVEDIQRFLAGEAVSVLPDPWWSRARRWCRRHPALTAGGLGSVVVLTVCSMVFGVIVHRAHQAELRARLAAEVAREKALSRLAESREAGDAWLIGLSGSLQFFPGMQGLRSQLLEEATSHYKQLAEQLGVDHNADATLELVRCQLRLGDLYRLRDQQNRARDFYSAAQRLLSTDTRNWAERIELANARIGLALLGDEVDLSAERAWLLSAIEAEDLSQKHHDQATNALARVALAIARHPEAKRPQVMALLEEAESHAERLVDRRGQPRDHQLLQSVRDELGPLRREAGQLKLAQSMWQSEVARLTRLTEAHPDRPDLLQSLAFARMQKAEVEAARLDESTAAQDYEKAINDLKQAWQATDADSYFRRNVASAHTSLSRVLNSEPAAQTHLDAAVEHLRQAVASEGPSAADLARLATCYSTLGQVAERLSHAKAASHYNSAEQCYVILGDHGQLTPALTARRAENFACLGRYLLRQSEDLEAAEAALARADALVQAVLASEGLRTEVDRRSAFRLQAKLSSLRAEHELLIGNKQTSDRLREESIEQLRALAQDEQAKLAETYPAAMELLFDALVEHDDRDEHAEAEARQWLELMATVCPTCTRSFSYQQRLSIGHLLAGKRDLATEALAAALEIRPQDRLSRLLYAAATGADLSAGLLEEAPGDYRLQYWATRLQSPAKQPSLPDR